MSHDEANRLWAARLLSTQLARADVVEAVYRGADLALAGFVGRASVWVVVGNADGMALLAPQALVGDPLAADPGQAVPLSDFDTITQPSRPTEEP